MTITSTKVNATADAADEAGGESIYCSDGLPPLPCPPVPASVARMDNEELLLDSTTTNDSATLFFSKEQEESLYDTMIRLKKEVALLVQNTNNTTDQELTNTATELQQKLEAMTKPLPQEDLVQLMEQYVLKEQQIKNQRTTTDDNTRIVYELYGATGHGRSPASSFLEQRLIQMEQLLGDTHQNNNKSVMQRLKEMEAKVQQVDAKSLDDASIKAKVIRADLEGAAKAMNKLSSLNTSSSTAADSKVIAELHRELVQLEGLSAHLPLLAHRLEQLAHLHVQSSTMTARMSGAEQDVRNIQSSLKSMEGSIGSLEQSMMEMTKRMDGNLKAMEDRFDQL